MRKDDCRLLIAQKNQIDGGKPRWSTILAACVIDRLVGVDWPTQSLRTFASMRMPYYRQAESSARFSHHTIGKCYAQLYVKSR